MSLPQRPAHRRPERFPANPVITFVQSCSSEHGFPIERDSYKWRRHENLAKLFIAACLSALAVADSFASQDYARFGRGTIVLVEYTHDLAIIAAGSREVLPDGTPNDDFCKIIGLGSNTFFFATGRV